MNYFLSRARRFEKRATQKLKAYVLSHEADSSALSELAQRFRSKDRNRQPSLYEMCEVVPEPKGYYEALDKMESVDLQPRFNALRMSLQNAAYKEARREYRRGYREFWGRKQPAAAYFEKLEGFVRAAYMGVPDWLGPIDSKKEAIELGVGWSMGRVPSWTAEGRRQAVINLMEEIAMGLERSFSSHDIEDFSKEAEEQLTDSYDSHAKSRKAVLNFLERRGWCH